MVERLGDAPIEGEFLERMNLLAAGLDKIFNGTATGADRKVGFVLLTFNFGDKEGERCNYISNAERLDVISLMKEQLARFEGQPEVKGKA